MAEPLAVVVIDEQRSHPVDVAHHEALARHVLERCGVTGSAELNVLFVDENEMARLNRRHMGESGPTDVLSFPLDAVEDAVANGPRLLGDVVVCPMVADRSATQGGHDYLDELRLLVVHGVLHVLGMDHAEPDDAAAMRARETALLTEWAEYRR